MNKIKNTIIGLTTIILAITTNKTYSQTYNSSNYETESQCQKQIIEIIPKIKNIAIKQKNTYSMGNREGYKAIIETLQNNKTELEYLNNYDKEEFILREIYNSKKTTDENTNTNTNKIQPITVEFIDYKPFGSLDEIKINVFNKEQINLEKDFYQQIYENKITEIYKIIKNQ